MHDDSKIKIMELSYVHDGGIDNMLVPGKRSMSLIFKSFR